MRSSCDAAVSVTRRGRRNVRRPALCSSERMTADQGHRASWVVQVVGTWVTFALSVLSLFGFYALLALGMGLIFGQLGVVNVAFGDFAMAGAFVMYALQPVPFVLRVLIALLLGGAVAWAIERFLLRSLYAQGFLATLLAMWGVGIVLRQTAEAIFGSTPASVEAPVSGSISVLGVQYPTYRLGGDGGLPGRRGRDPLRHLSHRRRYAATGDDRQPGDGLAAGDPAAVDDHRDFRLRHAAGRSGRLPAGPDVGADAALGRVLPGAGLLRGPRRSAWLSGRPPVRRLRGGPAQQLSSGSVQRDDRDAPVLRRIDRLDRYPAARPRLEETAVDRRAGGLRHDRDPFPRMRPGGPRRPRSRRRPDPGADCLWGFRRRGLQWW